jgi:2',3'-cyclic-nucleotide 2'-phosphodiesterase
VRLLFLGDIVGRSGREAVVTVLPQLKRQLAIDCAIVNAENAAGGFGITEAIAHDLFAAGADCLTSGNHAFDQKDSHNFIDSERRFIRPANYPPGVPGRGTAMIQTPSGATVLVMNLMGRIFMDPLDDPFQIVDRELNACKLGQGADAIVVDIHAEATSEKMAMGQYCDGRASLVVGTHSHIPTADAQILPMGTAYQTDAGACADYDSVIGMEKTEPLVKFVRRMGQGKMQPAAGPATVCGVFVETDPRTGLARRIEPVRVGGRLKTALPEV